MPWDYICANGLDFFEGNIVKYITRWRESAGGVEDLDKVINYARKLKENTERESR